MRNPWLEPEHRPSKRFRELRGTGRTTRMLQNSDPDAIIVCLTAKECKDIRRMAEQMGLRVANRHEAHHGRWFVPLSRAHMIRGYNRPVSVDHHVYEEGPEPQLRQLFDVMRLQ